MADRFGPRGVFAILVPLQNANQQPEYESMRPEGVNNQIYRFDIADQARVPQAVIGSVGGALGCWPDMIICGNSLEMRDWSRERQAEYVERLTEKVDGTPLVTATEACEAALRTVGARKIAILSPMGAEHSHSAEAYYRSLGFDVAGATWLKAKESKDIINVTIDDIVGAFDTIDSDDIDTILHLGGALGIVSMIEEFEAKFGKPVVSVNAATYWYALRKHGLSDPMPGFGQLLMNEAVAI